MITDNDPRRYLFFDTETTGIPKDYKAPLTDSKNWPRLVQIAWIYQQAGQPDKTGNYIIQPVGFIIPKEASKIHGITQERALIDGVDIISVLWKFSNLVKEADLLVGHNISFDRKIVGAEYQRNTGLLNRLKDPDPLEGKGTMCTMMKSTQYCRLPGKRGFKWPTLHELYFTLFGKGFENAHDASGDISATVKCFWELRKKEVILL